MSNNLDSFIIDFYSSFVNGMPTSTLVTSAIVPSSSSITSNIQSLIDFIKTNGVTISSYTPISNEINSLISSISSNPSLSDKYSESTKNLQSSTTSKDQLLVNLTDLQKKLASEDTSSEIVTPDEDTSTTPPPTNGGNVRSKRTTGSTSVTKNKSIGEQLSSLQKSESTTNANLSTFITKLKAGLQSIIDGTSSSTSNPISNMALTSKNANVFNTQGKTKSGTRNNLINNIAERLIGATSMNGAPKSKSTTSTGKPHSNSLNELMTYVPTSSISVSEPVTTTNIQSSNYYEISTTKNSGYITVMYSYFLGGSATSSYAFSFSLSPLSLISLSMTAFNAICKSSTQVKNEVCERAGYAASTNPTNSDLWNSYLIWLFSYLGTGVASQLGYGDIMAFPTSSSGSVNYMLMNKYMESVGNFGLTIQMYNLDSMSSGLTSISVPGIWPSLMYLFDKENNQNTHEEYKAKSIVTMLSSQMSTTA